MTPLPLRGLYCRVTNDLLEYEQLAYPFGTKVKMTTLPGSSSQKAYNEQVLGGSSMGTPNRRTLAKPEKLCVCYKIPAIIRELP